MKKILFPLLSIVLLLSCSNKATIQTPEELLKDMTIKEKVGQLFIIGFHGQKPDYYLTKMINERNIGGVILMKSNLKDSAQVKKLTSTIQKMALDTGPKVPLFISIDQEGGIVSRAKFKGINEFTAQNKINSTKHAYSVALNRGKELKALGIHINYSPVVEHITDSASFLFKRVFSNKDSIENYSNAMLKAYAESGITGVIKHYPGHLNSSQDSHKHLPITNLNGEQFIKMTESFGTIIKKNNPNFLMMAHVIYPHLDSVYPASLSKPIMDDLKNRLNYQGLIMTDDMEMKAISNHFDLNEASVKAIQSGVDLLVFTSTPQKQADAFNAILKALKNGEITEKELNSKVLKILKLKQKLISKH